MAGSVTLSSDYMYPLAVLHSGKNTKSVREITIACVGDSVNGSIPDTNLCNISGLVHGPLSGWGLWAIETVPGATAPDANCDVYLRTAGAADWLGGNGVDGLDAATPNLIYPSSPVVVIGATLTLDVDNQTAVDAIYSVILYLVR